MKSVEAFLHTKIDLNDSDTVVIGLSGGPDSMVLLHHLINFRYKKNINIVCAHVNHNLRKESYDEALFVEKYCLDNNVIFEMMKITEYTGNSFSEKEAREKRYNFFDEIVLKYNAKYLFTAHHGDDLMETMLMRIVRGSSIKGYAGFEAISKRGKYFIARPLIGETKQSIMEYANIKNIPYVIDASNTSDHYTRNRYRKYVISPLKNEDINVHQKFYKFSTMLLSANEFIQKETNKIYDKIFINNKLNVSEYKLLDYVIQISIINNILNDTYKNNIDTITNTHTNLIYEMLNDIKPNDRVYLPLNYEFVKEYNEAYIKQNTKVSNYNYELEDKIVLPNGKAIEIVSQSNDTTNFTTYLNKSDLNMPLYVRTRRDGDIVNIKNMIGHKKINDIFINEKIPLSERDIWPIVVDSNNNVVWIPGLKKSNFDSQKTQKYDIILRYY